MAINPASGSGVGQLRWVNLRSSSLKSETGKNPSEVSGSTSAEFSALLQERTLQPGDRDSATALNSLGDNSSLSGLLWQQLGGTSDSYDAISGEITETRPTDYEELIQTASTKYGVAGRFDQGSNRYGILVQPECRFFGGSEGIDAADGWHGEWPRRFRPLRSGSEH